MINFKEYTADERFNLIIEKLANNFKVFDKEIQSDVESKIWGFSGSLYNKFCSGAITIETPLNTSNFYYGSFGGLPKNKITKYIKNVVKTNIEFMKEYYENEKEDFNSFEEYEESWFDRGNEYLVSLILRVYFLNKNNDYYTTNQGFRDWLKKDNLAVGIELAVKHIDNIYILEVDEWLGKEMKYVKLNKDNILENYKDIENIVEHYKEVYKKYFRRGLTTN